MDKSVTAKFSSKSIYLSGTVKTHKISTVGQGSCLWHIKSFQTL